VRSDFMLCYNVVKKLMMQKFWFKLIIYWNYWIISRTLLWTIGSVFIVLLGFYIYKGMPTLNQEVEKIFYNIAFLSFLLSANAFFLLHLVLSIKVLFKKSFNGYRLCVSTCDLEENIQDPYIEDLFFIWRSWLLRLLWIILFIMLFILILKGLDLIQTIYFFNAYSLYAIIMFVGGYLMKTTLVAQKKVSIRKII